MSWFFCFFTVSGFCSLIYEVVWLRLAMAAFGVNTPLVSLFLSIFMAGLGLGSWLAGRFIRRQEKWPAAVALRLYALTELLIAAGAAGVPSLLSLSHAALSGGTQAASWGSFGYYAASGLCMAVAMGPCCFLMGATMPLAMAVIRKSFSGVSERSFSYLYLANVLGAAAGASAAAFLFIELFGFRATVLIAVFLNTLIAAAACVRSWFLPRYVGSAPARAGAEGRARSKLTLVLLFMTGCVSMAMELVWTRQFIPYLGLHVYAFAGLLAVYLLATYFGSAVYRGWENDLAPRDGGKGWALAGLLGCSCLIFADPRLPLSSDFAMLRLFFSVIPFSAAVGFLTPMLVDHWSQGSPDRAGAAYAVNVLGCIVGPLLAGFGLLPLVSERWAALTLLLPFFAAGLAETRKFSIGAMGLAIGLACATKDFESSFPRRKILRDNTATAMFVQTEKGKSLLVNGVGVTIMSPPTKWMAHLPLAFLTEPPRDALVICFGMGTTFRSLLSWGINATAVELIPSVPKLFGYYHADGPRLLESSRAQIVIDDGRRYLERTRRRYDVITIDPPPPIEAAGNSLLYSREFYEIAKKRLRPGGILQQWHWREDVDIAVVGALTRALKESFPHVRMYWIAPAGFHFLASLKPIPQLSAREMARRLPPEAVKDLMEWAAPKATAEQELRWVSTNEIQPEVFMAAKPGISALRDDRPINEYYLLRRLLYRDGERRSKGRALAVR